MKELRKELENGVGRINEILLDTVDSLEFIFNVTVASKINTKLLALIDAYTMINEEKKDNWNDYRLELLKEDGYNKLVKVGKEFADNFYNTNDKDEKNSFADGYKALIKYGLSIFGYDRFDEYIELTGGEDIV